MSVVSHALWNELLQAIRRGHPEVSRGWFALLAPADLRGGVLTVCVPEDRYRDYLEKRGRAAFTEAVREVTGRLASVRFVTQPKRELPLTEPRARPKRPGARESGLAGRVLNADLTFDSFVVGSENRFAHAAALAVAESPKEAYNPLYLYGSSGVGKSHLVHAICNQASRSRSPFHWALMRSDGFASMGWLEGEDTTAPGSPRDLRQVDLLAVEDLQRLFGRENSQEEFFHTFNALLESRSQVVLTADRAPVELGGLEDRLISRFNSGLVVGMDLPSHETRLGILRNKARIHCIDVSEDVLELTASRITSNGADLEEALLKMNRLAESLGTLITLSVAQRALHGRSRAWITLPLITDSVSRRFGTSLEDLTGPGRSRAVALPRQVCMYLARKLTVHSLQDIGRHFGGRDHSTVLHAIRQVEGQVAAVPELRALVDELRNELAEGSGQTGVPRDEAREAMVIPA